MLNVKASIKIPTYKEAFILRRVLIDLGYKQKSISDIKKMESTMGTL